MAEKHPKRPRDLNQWAKRMTDIVSGEVEDREPTPEEQGKDPAAAELGKKGGKARAKSLSPLQRSAAEIVLIGDSHGNDVFIALHQNGVRLHVLGIAYPCQPVVGERPIDHSGTPATAVLSKDVAETCERSFAGILDSKEVASANTILIAARWKSWAVERIGETLVEVKKKNGRAQIIVFGPTVEYDAGLPGLVERFGRRAGLQAHARQHEEPRPRILNDRIRQQVVSAEAIYVDKFAILCGEGPCPVLVPDTDELMVWDYGHWTLAGAKHFGERLKASSPATGNALFHGVQ